VTTERGPKPPKQGAWLGAWVKTRWSTPAGRAAGFNTFEQQAGGQLPIVHNFQQWGDEFPGPQEKAMLESADLLLLSWAGTDTRSITNGSYDALIRQRAEAVKAWGVPFLLRFRWEMDRPNLKGSVHSPEDYVAAWKHARRIFTEVGAMNAAWVWCPHVLGFVEPERNAAAYYPGDDQVDWLCVDVYAGYDFHPFGQQTDSFLEFAQKHQKPIMIAEFGAESGNGRRPSWIREARDYTKAHPQIKALVYFAEKQDRKPAYDTSFEGDPDSQTAFREMVADPYFQAPVPRPGSR
jgi:hypothetical protein